MTRIKYTWLFVIAYLTPWVIGRGRQGLRGRGGDRPEFGRAQSTWRVSAAADRS